jgi:hypothetical protein
VTAPLDGVLGDARHIYRGNAVRLLLIAAALFGPAAGLDVLITVNRWPGGWCDMTDGVAALLLLVIVAARLPARLAGAAQPASKPATSFAAIALRSAAAAAILAALAIAMGNAESIAGRLAFLMLPGMYLIFMWSLAVPVIVIEGTGPLTALRRSWRLIHGHGPWLFLELIKAWAALIAVMLIPLFIAADPGLPFPLRMRLLPIVPAIAYGPFAAIALTLVYYRLAEARSAAALDPAPQPES